MIIKDYIFYQLFSYMKKLLIEVECSLVLSPILYIRKNLHFRFIVEKVYMKKLVIELMFLDSVADHSPLLRIQIILFLNLKSSLHNKSLSFTMDSSPVSIIITNWFFSFNNLILVLWKNKNLRLVVFITFLKPSVTPL
jgi:hypothetical protein